MTVKNGNISAINNLGDLYYNQDDIKNAKKYYLMVIEKGNTSAINNLGYLYIEQGNFGKC